MHVNKCFLSRYSFVLFYFCFCFSRAARGTYGSSQGRGWIRATSSSHSHSHRNTRAMSVTNTTAHSNAGSLTHWMRPGIKPSSSWILIRFVTTEPQREFLDALFKLVFFFFFKRAFIYLFIFVFLPFFLGPLTWHMEVPRLGIEWEL